MVRLECHSLQLGKGALGMLKVERYTQDDEAKVVAFIRKVQPSAKPDRQILLRSVLIKDDIDIVGMVSYEPYHNMGVIRYFLYDARVAGTDITMGMFFELYKAARTEGVKKIVAQVPCREVGMLFEMLGFSRVTGDLSEFEHLVKKDTEVMLISLEGQVSE